MHTHTLLVDSWWDIRGFRQGTGDLHLPVEDHHGVSEDGAAVLTLQAIRTPQSGERGYVDINLGQKEKGVGLNVIESGRENENTEVIIFHLTPLLAAVR